MKNKVSIHLCITWYLVATSVHFPYWIEIHHCNIMWVPWHLISLVNRQINCLCNSLLLLSMKNQIVTGPLFYEGNSLDSGFSTQMGQSIQKTFPCHAVIMFHLSVCSWCKFFIGSNKNCVLCMAWLIEVLTPNHYLNQSCKDLPWQNALPHQ